MNSKSDIELPKITNVTSYIVNKQSSIVYLHVAVADNALTAVGEFLNSDG